MTTYAGEDFVRGWVHTLGFVSATFYLKSCGESRIAMTTIPGNTATMSYEWRIGATNASSVGFYLAVNDPNSLLLQVKYYFLFCSCYQCFMLVAIFIQWQTLSVFNTFNTCSWFMLQRFSTEKLLDCNAWIQYWMAWKDGWYSIGLGGPEDIGNKNKVYIPKFWQCSHSYIIMPSSN